MSNFVSYDPLNNLTNLYQRPIFIPADRAPRDIRTYPTSPDIQPAGTQWEDQSVTPSDIYETNGGGYWYRGNTDNLAQLTGNTGFAVPDSDQNINILGTSGQINVVGSGSTLTLSLAGGGTAIDSFVPDTGTSPVVPTATGQVTMTGGNGIQTTGGTNQLTFDMQSPFTGDFIFTDSVAGNTQLLTISNTDNTAASASSAALAISVGGSTQTGDPYALWAVGSSRSFCFGIDTSSSFNFNLNTSNSASVTPSTGTTLIQVNTAGGVSLPAGNLTVARAETSGLVTCTLRNLDNTHADSSVRLEVVAGDSGGTTGDAYILFSNLSVPFNYEIGQETSDNSLVINFGANSNTEQLSGTSAFKMTTTGNVTLQSANTNTLSLNNVTQTTVGAAGAASALPANPTGYINININGNPFVIPYYAAS